VTRSWHATSVESRSATDATQQPQRNAHLLAQQRRAVCAVVHLCLLPTARLCSRPFVRVWHEPSTVTEGNRLVCLFVCSFVLGAPLSATSEVVQRAVLRVRTRRCNDAKMHHLACFRRHLACSMHSFNRTAGRAGPVPGRASATLVQCAAAATCPSRSSSVATIGVATATLASQRRVAVQIACCNCVLHRLERCSLRRLRSWVRHITTLCWSALAGTPPVHVAQSTLSTPVCVRARLASP
jgi:hypothetical protein